MITDKMVEAAVQAQARFKMVVVWPVGSGQPRGWAVVDSLTGEEVCQCGTRKEAEDATLWHGQKAALEAAERARAEDWEAYATWAATNTYTPAAPEN